MDHTPGTSLITRKEAARILGLESCTLDKWAVQGIGPAMIRLSARCVRYELDELRRFINEHRRISTTDRGESLMGVPSEITTPSGGACVPRVRIADAKDPG